MNERNNELKNTTYEIFIGLISILSIFNVVLYYAIPSEDVSMVVAIMDSVLTVVLLSDFLYRFFTAHSKREYFFRQFGWADLLASLPIPRLKLLRIFRIVRVARLLHDFGPKRIFTEFLGNRAASTLFILLFFTILLLEFGGMAVLAAEQYAPDATIKTGGDAVWYTFVTITTVGYGDTYPVTNRGRLIGLLIMAVGVGLFGTLTGFLSNFFLGGSAESEADADVAGETPVTAVTPSAAGEPSAGEQMEAAQHPAGAAVAIDARTKVAELKRLLAEQQQAQAVLARKIEEIEALL